ncbi:hypothetical protein CBR_g26227 [Chara braunii]|uniref:Reverse transcriptase/retrotransposon-derived protein RNase H-like domain-containing protein n=1 Tax=Chara braunii TaxID=69332 RepID=A0A388L7D6_CHABU|nr:hypothetical protein CBR_g26227 [Chara braunii]|eukprot:GBG78194.1 hypothetical protein CBR_g26227 [Chara braunii]
MGVACIEGCGLKVALEKSEFFLSEISFLGYIVTVEGLKPDPRKVAAVREAPAPVTLTQVQAFLGLASYYRRFIRSFACLAKPLTNLLKKEEQLIWTPECKAAFRTLKEALTSAPVLVRPDPTRQFTLHTDWQPQAISAVLTQQGTNGREHVIEYASKTLSQAQSNYEACKGECLAVVWGIEHFRPYLYGQKFVLVTDHQPLLSLRHNTDYTGTVGRWAVRLQDYDFDIRHRATRQHGNAGGLTRLLPPNKCPANERLIPWKPEAISTEPCYGGLHVLRKGDARLPYPMRNFPEYLVELTDVEQLPPAGEDAWERHQALYSSVVLGMFPFFVEHKIHNVDEFLYIYYVIAKPKPERKEGTMTLYPFGRIGTNRPGLLQLIHIELLSIEQVIAAEEEDLQLRLWTASASCRAYNAAVIPDYLAREGESMVDFGHEDKLLRPPSSYPKPAALKASRKRTVPKRRRSPSPEAQASRVGPVEEVVQPAPVRGVDPVR